MMLTCPHGKPLVGKDYYGIYSYYHVKDSDGEETPCELMNTIGRSVQSILPYYAQVFSGTPEYRAAFLVSSETRKNFYISISKIQEPEVMHRVLFKLYTLIHKAAYENRIWGEMQAVFGAAFTANMWNVEGIRFADFTDRENLPGYTLPMVNIQTKQVEQATTDAATKIETWKTNAAQAAMNAAAASSYHSGKH